MLEVPLFSSSQEGSMTVPGTLCMHGRAELLGMLWECWKRQPGHLWSEKVLGHALKDKTRPLFGLVMLGSLPSRAYSNRVNAR